MELSILIPARNEEFLKRTIDDILSNIEADTEVIAVLDGQWTNPSIPQHPRVNVIYLPESIGQRAATNMACRLSKAKYVMKCDAHCAFDKGFDRKLIDKMQDNWTMIPTMRNLHAFDWVCECGARKYQDKGGTCDVCKKQMVKDVVWIAKPRPESNSYLFDSEPHFQYFNEWTKKEPYLSEQKTGLTESMSIQGSCFMLTREKYWELDICDEGLGSWGSQGIEVACKTWLSGGRVVVNHTTWYAHMFRTKAVNDFGFPYPISGKQTEHAKKTMKNTFFDNTWDKQIYPLSWLIEKFDPPETRWSKEQREHLKSIPLTKTDINGKM